MANNSNRGLTIAHLNVRGISRKIDELSVIIHRHNLKLLAISETFLTPQHTNNLLNINNFVFERRDRLDKHGGGVCLFIHNTVHYERISSLESALPESVAILVKQPHTKPFIISCLYRPPTSNSSWMSSFNQYIELCSSISTDITVLGDFNINLLAPNVPWHTLTSGLNLSQLINKPTRIQPHSRTLIDHIYTTQDHNYTLTDVVDLGLSDHSLILTTRKSGLKAAKSSQQSITYYKLDERDEYNFLTELSQTTWNHIYLTPDANAMLDSLTTTLHCILHHHIRQKTKFVKSKTLPPWLDKEVMDNIKKRDWLKKKEKWAEYKRQRNYTTNLITKRKKEYIDNIVAKSKGQDTRPIWNLINNRSKTTTPITISDGQQTYSDPTVVASVRNNHFTGLKPHPINSTSNSTYSPNLPEQSLLASIPLITPTEIIKYINDIPLNKAAGHDQLSPRLLRISLPYILTPLCDAINRSITEGVFPKAWKHAVVTPLYKKGPATDPSNYRPISVLPILSKILERHILLHLNHFLKENNILNPNQSGFRPKHSCTTAVYKLYSDWLKTNRKHHLALIFIDFSKAFDTVPRNILIQKLQKIGITDLALKLLQDFLSQRSQQVRVDGHLSTTQISNNGVPQGSILSPTLFSIFLNDLLTCTQSLDSHAYADDTIFHTSDTSIDRLVHKTQQDINLISQWCENHGMKINKEKSHFLITKAENTTVNLTINSTPLTRTNETTLLGFTVNQTLTWSDHIQKLMCKLAKNIQLLLATRHLMNLPTAKKFYNHFIHSHLNYGIEIYYPLASKTMLKSIQTIQKKALKYVLKVPRRTSTQKVIEDTNVLLLPQLSLYSTCTLAFKINRNLCPKYLTDIFKTCPKTSMATRNLHKIPSSFTRSTLDHYTMNSFNSLPQSLRAQKSIRTFKKNLKLYLLNATTSYR